MEAAVLFKGSNYESIYGLFGEAIESAGELHKLKLEQKI